MSRYLLYFASLAGFLLALVMVASGRHDWPWLVLLLVSGALSALGTLDVLQKKSTLRRNYPILAHFRYGLESVGPEIRQYFIERDTEEVPYSREQRALVYQRAKSVSDVVPFGTEKICDYLNFEFDEFFSWNYDFEGMDELCSAGEITEGRHRVRDLPPRFDFFERHPSQAK